MSHFLLKASPQNVQAGKPAQTAAQNPSLASRGKGPAAAAHGVTRLDVEEYRRKLQASGKQAALNSAHAQNLANGAGLPDEYLMALARGHQFPNGSQPQAHVPGQHLQQTQHPSQPQTQMPPGSIMSNVLSPHQQLLQQQEVAHPNSAAIAARRASQAMLQQGVNRAGAVMHEGMIVDPQTKVDDRRAATVAVIASTAAAVGLNYTREQLRSLSQTQLQQIAHVISQRNSHLNGAAMQGNIPVMQRVRRNDAQISANPSLSAGMGTNMANWMTHFGNAAQGGGSQVGVGQTPVLGQTLPLDERKQTLQHGSSPRANAVASSGKSDPNNLSANPAGVSVPQMNEILARQVLKVDKSGNSTQDKKTAEVLQDPSGARSSQSVRSAAGGRLPGGGAITAGLPSSRSPSGQRAATAGNASEEEFWAKLEDMQRKYRESLKGLLPVIQRIQERYAPEKRKLFMQHLRDAVNILNIQRTSPTPERFTLDLLGRAEKFIQDVVNVHTNYVKESIEKNSRPRKAQAGANLEEYVGQVPVGAQYRSGIPPQATSRLSAAGRMHQVKSDAGLQQGAASELDLRRQQYALRQQIEQQKLRQLIQMQQSQPTGHVHGVLSNGTHADLSKGAAKNTTAKGGTQRPRRNAKTARASQGLAMSRATSGVMLGKQQLQQAQVHGQGQVVAAAQQQAQATVDAQAAAARASLESQAAKAQAEVQALGKVQVKSQGTLYPVGEQASRMQQQSMQSQAPNVRLNSQGVPTSAMDQHIPQWGGSNMPGAPVQGTGPGASRAKRPELTIPQRMQLVDARVKEACDQAQKLEAMHEAEVKRDKSERIQTTLAALRNTSSATSGDGGKTRATKRQVSLVDVDNVGPKEGIIKSKTVFECSSEAGLRLAKRPKNEAADLRSLREAVEADCKAAKERNPLLLVEIVEEFGLPVVTCLLRIPEIRLPKLVLRVQRGYPRKGGATYGFERPPMGWIGVLEEIRTRFKRGLATAPTASVGVAAFLDAWATEADNVINGSCMSESR